MWRCYFHDFVAMTQLSRNHLLPCCRLAACIQVLFDVAESGWSGGVYIRHVHNELADCTHHNGRHRRSLLLRTLSQARSGITCNFLAPSLACGACVDVTFCCM